MNPIYIGVDFHAREQMICFFDSCEPVTAELRHQDKGAARNFLRAICRVGNWGPGSHLVTALGSSGCWSNWVTRCG
jgi:hypothetical protein